ncbi:nucleoside phosphatase family-domain-containing protein [Catenaria anguillulae PL171]|uniref:Nucleoside phosphatase family-domain-containing protein n=1 Tax=Catenaria anguillulae PL171 TaxID=765915 RepID=A0A1Y2HNQ7_9FUNG|nr:nucleoside phosphatase family-domain-containing protein [Catenaria anguillulae PL171]
MTFAAVIPNNPAMSDPSLPSHAGSGSSHLAEALAVPPPIAIPTSQDANAAPDLDTYWYSIVVDAGSSGSRIQIYRLSPQPHPPLHPELDDWQLKSEPGLSSFAHRLADLPAAFQPLLDFALATVPSHAHSATPIRVLATAGMRLLHLQEQMAILDRVCQVLAGYPFAFHPQGCHRTVRVISGEDEGMFGWLALNYLADRLTLAANVEKTLGFLDMGGASTQIAYAMPHDPSASSSHQVYKTLYLPTASKTTSSSAAVVPVDMHVTTPPRRRLDSGPVPAPGLPVTDELNPWHPSGDVNLVGQGDWPACLTLAQAQLARESPTTFVGVSEYWYSTHDLLGMGGAYVPEVLHRAAGEYCKMAWDSDEHRRAIKGGVSKERLRDQCFKSAWLAAVLHTGFGVAQQALPAGTTVQGANVCKVDEAQVMGKQHAAHPPPTHIQAGWRLPGFDHHDFGSNSSAATCIKPSVKVFTSDHVGDMQITWTLGSLVYDALPTGSLPPTLLGGGGGKLPMAAAASQITLVSLLFVVIAGAAFVYTRRRTRRSAATAAYYAHYYSGSSSPEHLMYRDPLRVKIKVWTGRMKAAVQSRVGRRGGGGGGMRSSSSSSSGSGADAEYHVPMVSVGEASGLRSSFGGEGGEGGSKVSLRGMI